jgi:hypothetical protein
LFCALNEVNVWAQKPTFSWPWCTRRSLSVASSWNYDDHIILRLHSVLVVFFSGLFNINLDGCWVFLNLISSNNQLSNLSRLWANFILSTVVRIL